MKQKGAKQFYYKKIEQEKMSVYIKEMNDNISVLNISKITGSLGNSIMASRRHLNSPK